ncbi:MAG: hypothetical protein J5644_01720 [Bacteroidales bacterium]|nr:hypothetical protein [Bacteroidales bacterium]
MKKTVFFLFLLAVSCCACSKYCTCSIGTVDNQTQNAQEIEIAYSEDCSDYSNANRSCR